jgi:hypothetical protein
MKPNAARVNATRLPALLLAAAMLAVAPGIACVADDGETELVDQEEDYGIEAPFETDGPLGKADSVHVKGPKVNTDTRATQVWSATEKWEDTDTPRAREAGIAWDADSDLNWDDKYALWVEAMERQPSNGSYFETFTLITPWNKTLPAPKLECAEMAMFLRATFAAWYNLPFFMTSLDSKGTRVFFGHFGARTRTARYKNTPKFGHWYKDYSDWSAEKLEREGWPQDQKLRGRGLYGGGDDMDFVFEGAKAGGYFDEIHLNKRVGHFLRFLLSYFGSMHLASSRNTFNLTPESIQEGDVLVERWQRQGIGHTLIIKDVIALDGGSLEAQLVSGSMPRRQPKWETGVGSKYYFTLAKTGGEGSNNDGEKYVELGGGIKRFRVTKNIGGYWTNTWMAGDEASWINDTDHPRISARPQQFDGLLGEVSPEQKRDALLALVEDARNHLRQYPASCSARGKREDAFEALYSLMSSEFNTSRASVDEDHRIMEDYVFAKLEYTASKTCCWNSTNSSMHQIVMDYNEQLSADQCAEPVVFKCSGGGYEVFKQFAEQTGRGHLWKPWSEDESCSQRGVSDDTILDTTEISWCAVDGAGGGNGGNGGNCADDGYEDNDSPNAASSLSGTSHSGLMVCSGDDDYYTVSVGSGGISVSVAFDNDDGDLDMELWRGSEKLGTSQSVGDSEELNASGAGTYTVRVYGYSGAQNAYSLSVN